jgi:hypothetical protein
MTGKYKTHYLPGIWIDEIIPCPLANVNDFVHRMPDGTFMMMPVDPDEQDESWRTPLEDGQIMLFGVNEHYGWFNVTIGDDGTVSAPEWPEKANCFCLHGDINLLVDTLDEAIANGDENMAPLGPGTHDFHVYWWADDEASFRFVVADDGTGRFEPCAGLH